MATPSPPKLTYRINAIPNKIQVSFLKETDKRILKVIQEGKGPFILKKNKAGRLKILDLKTYYKVTTKRVYHWHWASQVALVVKYLPANAGEVRDTSSIPWSRRSPGGGNGNPLQYSCLKESHGQKSLAGCSLWGHKESDMTEHTHTQ